MSSVAVIWLSIHFNVNGVSKHRWNNTDKPNIGMVTLYTFRELVLEIVHLVLHLYGYSFNILLQLSKGTAECNYRCIVIITFRWMNPANMDIGFALEMCLLWHTPCSHTVLYMMRTIKLLHIANTKCFCCSINTNLVVWQDLVLCPFK